MSAVALICAVAVAQLVPEPTSFEMNDRNSFSINGSTPIVVDPRFAHHAPIISDAVRRELPVITERNVDTDNRAIYVGIEEEFPLFEDRSLRRKLNRVRDPEAGGYKVIVDDEAAIVAGADAAGVVRGMHMIAQAIRSRNPLPGLLISDEPPPFRRGVRFRGSPPIHLIEEAAEMKADFILSETPAYLDGTRLSSIAPILERAEILGIGIVPAVRPIEDAGDLVVNHPEIAPTLMSETPVVLRGEAMAPLPARDIEMDSIRAPRVDVSGVPMRLNEDYALDQTAPGFPWTIRRVFGGAIPDGATVTVHYYEANDSTAGLSIAHPMSGKLFADALRRIVEAHPVEAVHVGPGSLDTVAIDGNARVSGKSLSELLTDFYGPVANSSNVPRLLIDPEAYALLPPQLKRKFTPFFDRDEAPAQSGNWLMARANPADAFPAINTFHEKETYPTAIVFDVPAWENSDRDAFRAVMDKAWSRKSPHAAWPDVLNGVLGTSFTYPAADEVLNAIIAHANRQTLLGIEPGDGYRTFRREVELHIEDETNRLDVDYVSQLYELVAEYLELEARFADKPSDTVLRQLVRFVETYAEANPDWPAERTARIAEVVNNQGLFVPSTIVFGSYLFPYRDHSIPSAYRLAPFGGEPEFTFGESNVRAAYFFGSPLTIGRIDFESANLKSIRVARGNDPIVDVSAPVASPIIPASAPTAASLNITGEGTGERVALRSLQVLALKQKTPRASTRSSSAAPRIDGRLNEAAWTGDSQLRNFTIDDSDTLAIAQTEGSIVRNGDRVYFGFQCHEPRMSTMEAATGPRDSVLWPQECLVIAMGGITVAVNPNGVIYDKRDGDPLWDGLREVAVTKDGNGWFVELAWPETASLNTLEVTRYRYNARREVSSWP